MTTPPRAAFAFAFLAAATPWRSFAQESVPPSLTLSHEQSEFGAAALARANRRILAGRGTLIGSSILFAGGVAMVGIAAVPFPSCETCDDSNGLKAVAVAGGVVAAAGLAGIIAGGVILADGKRAKKRVESSRLILAPAALVFQTQF